LIERVNQDEEALLDDLMFGECWDGDVVENIGLIAVAADNYMLVVTDKNSWYPVFMFVNDSTKIAYRFHLDRVRQKAKYPTSLAQAFGKKDFAGIVVNDIANKTPNDGTVTHVFKKYNDGFPKTVQINWKNGSSDIEHVIHPEDELKLREGLIFKCIEHAKKATEKK
jgi:hypothetical protein